MLNPPAAEAIVDGIRATLDTGEQQRIEFPITIGDRPRFEAAVLDLRLDELDGEPAVGFVV